MWDVWVQAKQEGHPHRRVTGTGCQSPCGVGGIHTGVEMIAWNEDSEPKQDKRVLCKGQGGS